MVKSVLSVIVVLVAVSSAFGEQYIPKSGKRVPQTLSRGWGDQLIWAQTYEEGLHYARTKNKPLMVLFHREDCQHSKNLKKVFAEDYDIQKMLDEDFIILNLVFETTDTHLSQDGQYVPRIIFVDPSMTVRADISGRYKNRFYAYEPKDMRLLFTNMQKAKKLLKSEL
ncbi:anterior gradient protein 2 homolog [Solea solea]|uniref:anterior gradient protein 2 homolog n=1 Tax=Solea solea TaxID=90069 RepID=UPI00272AB6E2|nr:anterior gradient protein 2 homolog [Solea solea]